MIRFLLLSLVLAGCGRQGIVDPEFKPYVDSFTREGVLRGKTDLYVESIDIQFGDHEELKSLNAVGYCKFPKISIDPIAWANFTTTNKEAIIFHELGHCVLDRPHTSDIISWTLQSNNYSVEMLRSRPISIMNPIILDGKIYSDFRQEYVDELFN